MAFPVICSTCYFASYSHSRFVIYIGSASQGKATDLPYEGGIEQTGSARLRFSAQFYLVAMLFVIFDVEAVFIMLWAVGFYDLGWPGYIGVAIFIAQLVVVLIYEWGIGALDFGPDGLKILKAYKKIKERCNILCMSRATDLSDIVPSLTYTVRSYFIRCTSVLQYLIY